jgi:signal transduction histidine kinase
MAHELKIQAPDELIIEGDRGKIISIFDNYLKNAAKYSDTGTTITIRLYETDDDMVAIEVTDQGIGIQPEDVVEDRQRGRLPHRSVEESGGRNRPRHGLHPPRD